MNKNKKKITICVLALIILTGIICFAVVGRKNGEKSVDGKDMSANQEQFADGNTEDKELNAKQPEGENAQGESSNKSSGGKGEAIVGTPNPVVKQPIKKGEAKPNGPAYISFPYKASEDKLVLQALDSYSGYYIEDGTEAEVKNITILEVKNISNEVLEYGKINLTSNGEKLSFEVSLLPPGKSAVVMEADKKGFSSVSNCLYDGSRVAYLSALDKAEDKVKVRTDEKGAVEVTNISGKKIPQIRVFYKNKLDSGEYIGGIAYTVKFDNVEAGESRIIYPSHFNFEYSEIMMIKTYDEVN